MKITVQRTPADKPGPSITNSLLTVEGAGVARGIAEINKNHKDRIIISGNGPKNQYMIPTKLVQVTDVEGVKKGIVTMYSRTYSISGKEFQITSSMEIETVV